MGRRKRKWTARLFESRGQRFQDGNGTIRADTSANIYESMLLDPAFATMKPRQQMLYVLCKAQFYGHRKPQQDYPDLECMQGDDKFYMNLSAVVQYGLYKRSGTHEFYGDLKELQRRGFIKCISNGRATKSKSVYQFSGEWKNWTPDKN